jgi:hypothetical protein
VTPEAAELELLRAASLNCFATGSPTNWAPSRCANRPTKGRPLARAARFDLSLKPISRALNVYIASFTALAPQVLQETRLTANSTRGVPCNRNAGSAGDKWTGSTTP